MPNRELCKITNVYYTASTTATLCGLFGSAILTKYPLKVVSTVAPILLLTRVNDAPMQSFYEDVRKKILNVSDREFNSGVCTGTLSVLFGMQVAVSLTGMPAISALLISSCIVALSCSALSVISDNSVEELDEIRPGRLP